MHHGFENGQRVPIHQDTPTHQGSEPATASELAHTAFVKMQDHVAGLYPSESRKYIRFRTLAARWLTTDYRNFSQKEYAKRHGIRPDSLCKAIAHFSKRFAIVNRRMKPRPDKPTYTYGNRVFKAQPRKRLPRPPSDTLGPP